LELRAVVFLVPPDALCSGPYRSVDEVIGAIDAFERRHK
jgi:hypothetical protein